MSAKLPDGSILTLATTYGAAKAVSAISNANPGVATSTAHGFANGDFVRMASGWSNLNDRVVRVAGSVTNAFNLDAFDTTLTSLFPAGSGSGTATAITAWQQISQILGFETSGGDQQFTSFSYLEQNFETQLPTVFSAQSIKLTIADDPSLAGYIALKAASDARASRTLRLTLPDGSFILYQGTCSLNETPSVTKGQVMAVTATFSLSSRPIRYQS